MIFVVMMLLLNNVLMAPFRLDAGSGKAGFWVDIGMNESFCRIIV